MSDSNNNDDTGLASAPAEVKLAVDLIMLFETNNIAPEVALAALQIVNTDLKRKLTKPC
ncbi:pleiotropic regulatory protein RsmS [Shewanella youngdeokensis]|uniref:Pleiotropic regulatory protein RsmS n=1 Tax=Shewanella youngdeokensis TaxID=2999068 RepID=A0ABZ0K2Q2_9GAMM|nr:pleiotropic regulatory protein RsmS [Shewanella sp. DAU334]